MGRASLIGKGKSHLEREKIPARGHLGDRFLVLGLISYVATDRWRLVVSIHKPHARLKQIDIPPPLLRHVCPYHFSVPWNGGFDGTTIQPCWLRLVACELATQVSQMPRVSYIVLCGPAGFVRLVRLLTLQTRFPIAGYSLLVSS